nr:substrate-binding domain-containing protein [Limosilactobacillus coleohominis]
MPKDLSIISIDGTFICDITSPTITSVSQQFKLMGQQSVTNLIKDADAEFIPVDITERKSVKNLQSL